MAAEDESEYEEMMNMINNIIEEVNDTEERVTALEKKVSDPTPPNETTEEKKRRETAERRERLYNFQNKDGSRAFTAMSSGLGGIKGRLSRRNPRRKMPLSLRRRKMSRSRRKSYSKMPLSLIRRKMSRSRRNTYKTL